jgi:hypothetical protein
MILRGHQCEKDLLATFFGKLLIVRIWHH